MPKVPRQSRSPQNLRLCCQNNTTFVYNQIPNLLISLFFTVYGVSDRASADIKYAQFLMCIKVHLLNIILANILTIPEKYELSKRSDIFSLCCDCKLQLPPCVSSILCFGTDYVKPDQTTHLRCLVRVYTACHFPFMEIGYSAAEQLCNKIPTDVVSTCCKCRLRFQGKTDFYAG